MPLIPPADAQKIKEVLDREMTGEVQITLLNEPGGALLVPGRPDRSYDEVAELLTELAGLSPKLKVNQVDVRQQPTVLQEYRVNEAPAIVFEQGGRRNIRFFGFPGGYEFSNLLQTIVQASKGESGVPAEYLQQVNALPDTLHLQVFVTPT